MFAAVAALALGLSACGGKHNARQPASQSEPVTASLQTTASLQPSSPPRTSVKLLWTHARTSFDDPQIAYVVRVTNHGDSPASVALNVYALDASGTIVGSGQPTMPNIPPRSQFDYYGELGGTASSQLTGKPATIKVSQAPHPFGQAGDVWAPLLQTSQLKLTTGSRENSYTDDPYAYNLSVKVTNNTGQEIDSGVTQQVILHDAAGHVIGGATGSSDNAPAALPAGASYREQWTGIPAVHRAASATYSVWPGEF
jgi:hypothetical protein